MLILDYNKVEDLDPLSGLASLQTLNIEGNPVKSVEPLAMLTEFRELILNFKKVDDLSPLANLQKLEKLHLESTRVADIEPLLELKSPAHALGQSLDRWPGNGTCSRMWGSKPR